MPPSIDTLVGDVEDLKGRVSKIEKDLEENTRVTKQVKEDTSGIVEAFSAAKGAFKVLETLGKLAKPVFWIAGVPSVVYGAWQFLKANILHLLK